MFEMISQNITTGFFLFELSYIHLGSITARNAFYDKIDADIDDFVAQYEPSDEAMSVEYDFGRISYVTIRNAKLATLFKLRFC